MRSDIAQLLANPACSAAQHAVYQALDQSLAENLAHIEAGLSLSELPVAIEDIEVEEDVPARGEENRESQRSPQSLARYRKSLPARASPKPAFCRVCATG